MVMFADRITERRSFDHLVGAQQYLFGNPAIRGRASKTHMRNNNCLRRAPGAFKHPDSWRPDESMSFTVLSIPEQQSGNRQQDRAVTHKPDQRQPSPALAARKRD